GGYWMIQVKSRAEAIEWAKRCPASENETIEVRQVQEMSDFPPEILPPKLGAREQELRDELQKKR
ncbi:MAG TPA: YciI family protein, partial [Burkholderiales bacterium]|nr:YciI family protein [Burkholderiales bacterium]